MEKDHKIIIQNMDGTTNEVNFITYLVNDDKSHVYMVYSKGEVGANQGDLVCYISRIIKDGQIKLLGIQTDEEWQEAIQLLKKVANA